MKRIVKKPNVSTIHEIQNLEFGDSTIVESFKVYKGKGRCFILQYVLSGKGEASYIVLTNHLGERIWYYHVQGSIKSHISFASSKITHKYAKVM